MNEAQIATSVMMACFLLIAVLSRSSTYFVLAAAYTVNCAAHWVFESTPAWSSWWPALYSTIDAAALIAITEIGDIRKNAQAWLLSALITMHALLAFDLVRDTSVVFVSYYHVVMAIIAIQATIGLWDAGRRFRRAGSASYSNCKFSNNGQGYSKSH